jgi:hypothetical protein
MMLVGMDALDPRRRFPATAPAIRVEASEERLDPIDCQELQWWFAIPRLGDRTAFAAYNVDTGELDWARQVVATAPLRVNGQDAVELQASEWSRDLFPTRIATTGSYAFWTRTAHAGWRSPWTPTARRAP